MTYTIITISKNKVKFVYKNQNEYTKDKAKILNDKLPNSQIIIPEINEEIKNMVYKNMTIEQIKKLIN